MYLVYMGVEAPMLIAAVGWTFIKFAAFSSALITGGVIWAKKKEVDSNKVVEEVIEESMDMAAFIATGEFRWRDSIRT